MRKLLLGFFIFNSCSGLFAQATKASSDAGLWTTVNFEKKLNDKFSILLTEEFRLRENFSRVNLFYTDIGLEVRPAKFLKVALSYRNIQKNLLDNTYSFRHRFQLDITLRRKVGNVSLAYRQRLQREVRNINTSEDGRLPEWYSRNKFTIKYDFDKPVTPYIAAEFRYQINNPRMMESNKTWHRQRYILGMDYKINDASTFGLFGLFQDEFNVKTPQRIYILGLEYSIVF